jgi:hypothetical protein
MGEGVGCKNK